MVINFSPEFPSYLPLAGACLRNQQPILEVLTLLFAEVDYVIEIGSGTGQHAVYCAAGLPHLIWQPTELEQTIEAVELWRCYAGLANVAEPVVLDVLQHPWPEFAQSFDAAFTANTLHFVSWQAAVALFARLKGIMTEKATFAVYGPFNENGQYTSEGNRALDAWLKERNSQCGIKDLGTIAAMAKTHGWRLQNVNRMPANNLMLVFEKGQ